MTARMMMGMRLLVLLLCMATAPLARADDAAKATAAAQKILQLLSTNQVSLIWSGHLSSFWWEHLTANNVSKEQFLSNTSLGRAQLGALFSAKVIDVNFMAFDPNMPAVKDVYSINFVSTYASGKFYERVVVVKDRDGEFKWHGIWGAPAPKD